MRTLKISAIAAIATLTATLASAPAFATSYGHSSSSYGHASYSHRGQASSYGYGHSSGHGYRQAYTAPSYKPTYYAPTYSAPTYSAPSYHAPTYHAPKYEAPKPTTSYETRPAYVYQKVAGYCTDVVKSYGYNTTRKTVECKAGDTPKIEAPIEKAPEAPAEPLK
jgi:hypothetical protein